MREWLFIICGSILILFFIYLFVHKKIKRIRIYRTCDWVYFGPWLKVVITDKTLLNETEVKLHELSDNELEPYVYGRKVTYRGRHKYLSGKTREIEGFEVLGKNGELYFIEADWVYGSVYSLPWVPEKDMYHYKYDYKGVSKYCFLALHAGIITPIYNDFDKATIETVLLEDTDFYGFQMWRYSPYRFSGRYPNYEHREKGTFARPINLI